MLRTATCLLAAIALLPVSSSAQPVGPPAVRVCDLMHAKAMPGKFEVPAMKFTGPAADGRRGSAGFVVPAWRLQKDRGTRLAFHFQRAASGYGFQVIHPLKGGHVVVTVRSGITIHRGGSWGAIGWGNPAGSEKVCLGSQLEGILPLKPDTDYQVMSQLTADGQYHLWLNGAFACQHQIAEAEPLVLEIKEGQRVWGGSGWDRTTFAGDKFEPHLERGHAGLILSPMDGSGPTHSIRTVYLSAPYPEPRELGAPPLPRNVPPPVKTGSLAATKPSPEFARHFEPLLQRIDDLRERGALRRTKTAGGGGGGPFESLPAAPSLLIGFDYTTAAFYGGHLTIKSLRPVYLGREGESTGDWHGVPHGKTRRVQAKPGYVVAGAIAQSGHRVDGLRLVFMRVQEGRLNPDDTYRSQWLGGRGGGGPTQYAANGEPVVGVFGKKGADIDALGFVQAAR